MVGCVGLKTRNIKEGVRDAGWRKIVKEGDDKEG